MAESIVTVLIAVPPRLVDLVALVKLPAEPDEAGGPPLSSSTDYGTCSIDAQMFARAA
jgi:hypothetical protein